MKTAKQIAEVLGCHHTSVGRLSMSHKWPRHKVRSKTGFRYEYDVSDAVLGSMKLVRGRPTRKFKTPEVSTAEPAIKQVWDIWPVKNS